MQNELKCFQETNFEHNHLYHKWEGYFSIFPDHDYAKVQTNVKLKNFDQKISWAITFLKGSLSRRQIMAGRGWVVVPSAEAVIGVFNPQLKLMNNDWFECTLQPRRALEKLRKLNPALLLTVQSLETFSVKHIADKHQVHTEGCRQPVGKMLRAQVAYQRCTTMLSNRERVAGAHWHLPSTLTLPVWMRGIKEWAQSPGIWPTCTQVFFKWILTARSCPFSNWQQT